MRFGLSLHRPYYVPRSYPTPNPTYMFNRLMTIVHRTEAGSTDIYGTPTRTATTQDVYGAIQQVYTSEPGEAGEFAISDWRVYFPSGTVLDTGDAVIAPGKGTFEVVGEPWDADEASGSVNHVESRVKLTVGAA